MVVALSNSRALGQVESWLCISREGTHLLCAPSRFSYGDCFPRREARLSTPELD